MATEAGRDAGKSCSCFLCKPSKQCGNSESAAWGTKRPVSERRRFPGVSRAQRRAACRSALAEYD